MGRAGSPGCGALLTGYASWFARSLAALRVLKVLALVVGPLETRWSLALRNPWFMIGGGCFLTLALAVRRRLTPDVPLNGT